MNGERILRWSLTLMLLGPSACAPRYDGLVVGRVSGTPATEASDEGFTVPEGGLIMFTVGAESLGSRDYQVTDTIELAIETDSIARLIQGLATDTWMIVGSTKGRTVLEVRINGELEEELPVDVIAREVSP